MQILQRLAKPALRVAYILSGTALSGGSKVVFEHASLLNKTGILRATVISPSTYPHWLNIKVPFVKSALGKANLSSFDVIITTFYDQGFLFKKWKNKPFLHLCQGFEGDYTKELGLEQLNREIISFYRLPYPKMVVSKHLVQRLAEISSAPVTYIGQAIDTSLFSPLPKSKADSILIVGQSEYPFKGVECSLKVATSIKSIFPNLKIVRVSPTNTRQKEASRYPIDEFWAGVPPREMPNLYRKAIICIHMPQKEGFGLPVLEALSSGVPVIASNIPPFREICGPQYPLPSSHKEAVELAVRLLTEPQKYKDLVEEGLRKAKLFSKRHLLARLSKAIAMAILYKRRNL